MEAHRPWCPTAEERARFLSPELVERSYGMDHSYRTRFASSFGFEAYSAQDLEVISGLYDASLWRLDEITGAILDELERHGLDERTLVVLVGDHGDHLGERGLFGHEYSLYEELLRVPLIVRAPGGRAGDRPAPGLQSTDVFGLVLERVGLAQVPAPEPDRPRVAAYLGPKLRAVEVVAQNHPQLDRARWLTPLRSIEQGGWKLIAWEDGRRELYHVAGDPREERDLAAEELERVAALEAALLAHVERARRERATLGVRSERAELDPEHLKRLRDLGYGGE